MNNYSLEVCSADELYNTCAQHLSTVLITSPASDLQLLAEAFETQNFSRPMPELTLLQSAPRDISHRVAVSLNVPIGNTRPMQVIRDSPAWWVLRLSPEVVIAKPAKEDAELGTVGMEILAEFQQYTRLKK